MTEIQKRQKAREAEGITKDIKVCGNCEKYEWHYDYDRHKGFCLSKNNPDLNCEAMLPEGLHALTNAKTCREWKMAPGMEK